MKATFISSFDLPYGINHEKPKLPAGFVYEEKEGEWLKAIAPDGCKWFVGKTRLYRCGIGGDKGDTSNGKIKPGAQYLDDNSFIDL